LEYKVECDIYRCSFSIRIYYTPIAKELAAERLNNIESVTLKMAMEIVWEVAHLFNQQANQLAAVVGYDFVTEKPLLPKKTHKKK
jgi:hypothetical protein